jgi:hypothetical protein
MVKEIEDLRRNVEMRSDHAFDDHRGGSVVIRGSAYQSSISPPVVCYWLISAN